MNKRHGFTFVELLVIIVIIGVLAVLATTSLLKARVKACDAKRVSDVKQLTTALEMYYYDAKGYPKDLPWGQPLINNETGTTFMNIVPQAPSFCVYGDACVDPKDKNYDYVSADINKYRINYCLDNAANGEVAGQKFAKPGVIGTNASSTACLIDDDCAGTGTCQDQGGGNLICACGATTAACPAGKRCDGTQCFPYCLDDTDCSGLTCDNGSCK
ncbi:MAG: type II secretion system protein [Candidatus Falkowbacteria bacterium]